MTEEQKATQEQARSPFEGMPCAEMMFQMMGGEGKSCCAGMMDRMMSQQGQSGCGEMMSQMMAMFAGMKGETEEKSAAEETK
jgi:hypothetical protein